MGICTLDNSLHSTWEVKIVMIMEAVTWDSVPQSSSSREETVLGELPSYDEDEVNGYMIKTSQMEMLAWKHCWIVTIFRIKNSKESVNSQE